MSTETQQLGIFLKRRREELHFSLKEVENATSIRMGYLQSIEEGNLDAIISPVYAQGFIRKYASFLDIDEKKLLAEHPQVERILAQAMTDPDFSSLGSIEVRGSNHKTEQKRLSTLVWVGGSSLVVLLVWWLIRYIGIV